MNMYMSVCIYVFVCTLHVRADANACVEDRGQKLMLCVSLKLHFGGGVVKCSLSLQLTDLVSLASQFAHEIQVFIFAALENQVGCHGHPPPGICISSGKGTLVHPFSQQARCPHCHLHSPQQLYVLSPSDVL